tara:strand:+ start:573 stop:797 length:225 start_codon:yes stop_codon:yes gene_type:complete
MTLTETAILVFIIYLCFPDEIQAFLDSVYVNILLAKTNLALFVRSYVLYLKLKSGMKRHGLEVPPFKFTLIQKR